MKIFMIKLSNQQDICNNNLKDSTNEVAKFDYKNLITARINTFLVSSGKTKKLMTTKILKKGILK